VSHKLPPSPLTLPHTPPFSAGSERGTTHADAFTLQETPGKWKWSSTKPGGRRPTPRSGVATATAANGKIYVFGGVMDTEEDDENLRGLFTNEIHFLDVQSGGMAWRKVEMKKKKEAEAEKAQETQQQQVKTTTDGIFTVTVAGPKQETSTAANSTSQLDVGGPSPRMNAAIAVVRHNLWIFGGSYEQGSRQYTLCDFYSLDVNKCDAWRTHIGNLPSLQWLGSDSEESSDSDDDDDDDEESDESDDDESDEMEMN
jgi:N-acetylneuraminic acid mutarotase